MTKTLYLLPNLLGENSSFDLFFPPILREIVPTLDGLFVESEKEGRRFLSSFMSREKWTRIPLCLCNEHTSFAEYREKLKPLIRGENWGLISDSGLPCIADPGSLLVLEARKKGIVVRAIPGPSSIFLALQLSGFSGQNFHFHGYLPREEKDLRKKLLSMEKSSKETQETHIWIETPYRTEKMCQMVVHTLQQDTLFCVAQNILQPDENVIVLPLSKWPDIKLAKVPSIFLIQASSSTAMWS